MLINEGLLIIPGLIQMIFCDQINDFLWEDAFKQGTVATNYKTLTWIFLGIDTTALIK